VERGIEWALKAAPVDYHCRSDFGFAFSRFANTELESLDRKTTILVLGDARNNYNDPQAWALRLIRERVKGIIWLNPEGQWGWGIGDSVMPMYAPACDLVRECRTIGQLGEVVDNLVYHWWRRAADGLAVALAQCDAPVRDRCPARLAVALPSCSSPRP